MTIQNRIAPFDGAKAEAFAERLHKEVRTQLWGYAPDEATGVDVRKLPQIGVVFKVALHSGRKTRPGGSWRTTG